MLVGTVLTDEYKFGNMEETVLKSILGGEIWKRINLSKEIKVNPTKKGSKYLTLNHGITL